MSDHVTFEELDALCSGELPPELGDQVEDHARHCPSCGRELAWLRAERTLIERRSAGAEALDPSIWKKVEERAYAPVPLRRRRPALIGAMVAVSAAAALAVIVRPVRPPVHPGLGAPDGALVDETAEIPPPPAAAALDRAEGDYRSALTVLEAEYARAREKLDPRTQARWDRAVSRARIQLADASVAAAPDVNARLRVLDGYAAVVRSLGHAIEESEEATR
jgi:anti-sigma factor RsiW